MTLNSILKKFHESLLFKVAFKSLTLKFSGAGFNFLAGVLIARFIGLSEFGIYSLIMSVSMLLGMLSSLGMAPFYTREAAVLKSQSKTGILAYLYYRADVVVLYTAIVLLICGALVIGSGLIGITWSDGSTLTWFLIAGIIAMSGLNTIRAAFLRGIGRVILADIPDIFLKPFLILVAIIIAKFFKAKFDSDFVISIQFFAIVSVFILATFLINRSIKRSEAVPSDTYSSSALKYDSLIFLFISFFTILQAQLPFYMTSKMLGHESAGLIQACLQLVTVLAIGLTAVNGPIQPKIATAWARGDKVMLQNYITASVRIASAISVVFFIIILIFSEFVLSMYGEKFLVAKTALKLLLIGRLYSAFCGPCGLLLIMTGMQKVVMYVFAGSILFGLVIGFFLIPEYGIEGAAITSIAIMIFWNTLMASICLKKLSINTFIFSNLLKVNRLDR